MLTKQAIITALYWAFGFITLAAYPFQLRNIFRDHGGAEAISIWAWLVWSGAYAASLAYAYFVVHAFAFAAISAGNLFGSLLIIFFTILKRVAPDK